MISRKSLPVFFNTGWDFQKYRVHFWFLKESFKIHLEFKNLISRKSSRYFSIPGGIFKNTGGDFLEIKLLNSRWILNDSLTNSLRNQKSPPIFLKLKKSPRYFENPPRYWKIPGGFSFFCFQNTTRYFSEMQKYRGGIFKNTLRYFWIS